MNIDLSKFLLAPAVAAFALNFLSLEALSQDSSSSTSSFQEDVVQLHHKHHGGKCRCSSQITSYGSFTSTYPAPADPAPAPIVIVPTGFVPFFNQQAVHGITSDSSRTRFTLSQSGIYEVEIGVASSGVDVFETGVQLFINDTPVASTLFLVSPLTPQTTHVTTLIQASANDVLSVRNVGANNIVWIDIPLFNGQAANSAYLDIKRVGSVPRLLDQDRSSSS